MKSTMTTTENILYYKKLPTVSGYYWMRSRRKWGRRFRYDVVWYSESAPGEVRIGGWQQISDIPNATFYGPLEPPEAIPWDEAKKRLGLSV